MKTADIRVLITGAGTGSSGNVIRALRAMTPAPHIVGVNHDRFTLKQSLADLNYLCPPCAASEFVDATVDLVGRERINVVMPGDDDAVKALSDGRERFPITLFLPRRNTIDLCQDKYALTVFLRQRAIAAPLTYAVRSLGDLDRIFARFSRNGLLWCRARRGSRSLAAIPVARVEQARAWITQWRDLRGVKVSDFTLSEYLPGRHFIVQSVWRDGRLLLAQSVEVLSYFAAGNNPSGVFSLSSLAKTVMAPDALQVRRIDLLRAAERQADAVKRKRIVPADRLEVAQRRSATQVVLGVDLEPRYCGTCVDDRLVMRKAQPDPGHCGNRAAPESRHGRGGIQPLLSGRLQLAALDLGAVACGKQHERLGIARFGGLARAGVGAFGAVVLCDGVDAEALLKLVLLHSRHVVLYGLWHVAHVHLSLRQGRRGLHRQGEANSGGESRSSQYVSVHSGISPVIG